jgi:hypothetical protein
VSTITVSTKVSAELYGDFHKKWLEVKSRNPAAPTIHYTIQPLATSAVQYGYDHGGNAMGLEKIPQSGKLACAQSAQTCPFQDRRQLIKTPI